MAQSKTNRGQIIDMEALIAAQGDRPAMGNAGTDAHGNVLGPDGKIETPAEERVRAYYEDNPMSSTAQQSLKGNQPQAEFTQEDNLQEVKTAQTAKENKRTAKAKPDTQTKKEPETKEPEPLGYKEVELPNGDIDMVPYYTEEEADEEKTKD